MEGSTNKAYQTMRMIGSHKKKLIHLLIDSGSTNNFLDLTVAKGLGCKLFPITPVTVTITDGQEVRCAYMC